MNEENLKGFREQLIAKRRSIVEVVQRNEDYGREVDSDEAAMDIADKASSSYTKEFMFSKSNADRQLLQTIDAALDRIDGGDYGMCQECGEEIGEKRLTAIPWADLCIKCQERQEQGRL